jgi:hypothetical protein
MNRSILTISFAVMAGGQLLRRRDYSAVRFCELNHTNWGCPTSRVFREVGRHTADSVCFGFRQPVIESLS